MTLQHKIQPHKLHQIHNHVTMIQVEGMVVAVVKEMVVADMILHKHWGAMAQRQIVELHDMRAS